MRSANSFLWVYLGCIFRWWLPSHEKLNFRTFIFSCPWYHGVGWDYDASNCPHTHQHLIPNFHTPFRGQARVQVDIFIEKQSHPTNSPASNLQSTASSKPQSCHCVADCTSSEKSFYHTSRLLLLSRSLYTLHWNHPNKVHNVQCAFRLPDGRERVYNSTDDT